MSLNSYFDMHPAFSFFDLPNEELEELEKLLGSFERQLRQNQKPDIRDFVSEVTDPMHKLYLVSVLVPMEMDFSGEIATRKLMGQYQVKYPELSGLIERVFSRNDLTHISEGVQKTFRSDTSVIQELKLWPGEQVGDRYRIVCLLGSGSFGVVYRAYDSYLKRDVALKVALNESARTKVIVKERFLSEAQNSARLKSDCIATIYDFFEEDGKTFIVQEFVAGRTLRQLMSATSFTVEEKVKYIVDIAKAVSYAHQYEVFHRDLKPSNIIVSDQGKPTIVDFGLAISSASASASNVVCGTPNYMSPEQVRGEVNRTDAKSDIWSLGVMLFEFLTGKRPFDAAETVDVFERVKNASPEHLQHYDPDLPQELNRIVFKCLAKLQSERYSDVEQLIIELERFLEPETEFEALGREDVPVVPKGLRAFSVEDREYFLQLLPGPRDYRGIPESVLFWKNQIENQGEFDVSPVGMIYGPSGCGKSSFVKAGLLPVLSEDIKTIYVESTQRETEIRLLKALRQRFPTLEKDISLPEAFVLIRDGGLLEDGEKLLVIIDQFEQWLTCYGNDKESQLRSALRHADGIRIQCLIMIREDYWGVADQFMGMLEIPLLQNDNCRAVGLFDVDHAKIVLEKFGRAYGRFDGPLSDSQNQFLSQVIEELSDNEKVSGARIALFAEAFQNKEWSEESLGKFGGAYGVGVTFLNDLFVNSNAPKKYRPHVQAVQNCLLALLPETGSNLKGHMVSSTRLQEVSGYRRQTKKFESLLGILDAELRLITATNPLAVESKSDWENEGEVYYQLSHDYLVPILRRWIDSERQRSVGGRLSARMNDAAQVWSDIGEKRYLPNMWETLGYCAVSVRGQTTTVEQQMIRASLRKHVWSYLATGLFLAVLAMVSRNYLVSIQQDRFIARLLQMSVAEVVQQVDQLQDPDPGLIQKLRNKFGELQTSKVSLGSRENAIQKLKIAIVLAEVESTNWDDVAEGIFSVELDEIPMLVEFLEPKHKSIQNQLAAFFKTNPNTTNDAAVRGAIALSELGFPEHLIRVILAIGPNDVETLVEFLGRNRESVMEKLRVKSAQLIAKVPAYPSPILRELFEKRNGVVGLSGAVIFSASRVDLFEVMKSAFKEGYLPVSFRPYNRRDQMLATVAWQRAFRDMPGKFEDWVQVLDSPNRQYYESKVQELADDGWFVQDVSYCADYGGNPVFTAILIKGQKNRKCKFEPNRSYLELLEDIEEYSEIGFQVARMFLRVDTKGVVRYSTVWDKQSQGLASYLPRVSQPRVRYADDNRNPNIGATCSDCQICILDPRRRDSVFIERQFRTRNGSAGLHLNLPVEPLSFKNSTKMTTMLLLLRWQDRFKDAEVLAKRFVTDLPDWTHSTVEVLKLYSILGDREKFENELERVNQLAITEATRRITVPLCELRYEVHSGNLEQAEELFEKFKQGIESRYEESSDEYTQSDLRALARSRLIVAKGYNDGTERREKLISEALEIFLNCEKYSYLYVLGDSDFDIVRERPEFHVFLWKHKHMARTIRTWRDDPGIKRKIEAGNSLQELFNVSKRAIEMEFQPRCATSSYDPYRNSLFGRIVWERNPEFSDYQDKKRLASIAVVEALLGQTKILDRINDGQFGESVKSMVPNKLKLLDTPLTAILGD